MPLHPILASIRRHATEKKASIVLPEAADERTLQAAVELAKEGIARPILLGHPEKIHAEIARLSLDGYATKIRILDPLASEKMSDYVSEYFTLRKAKGVTFETAKEVMKNPLYFAAMMVRRGEADGCVAGAVSSTADVLRAGIQIIGVDKRLTTLVSSFFLMAFPESHHSAPGKVFSFADCGVVPYPNAEELADIALTTARSHFALTGETPRIALLSFSTKGSAKHDAVDTVLAALDIAKHKDPSLQIDGEMQFDAAFLQSVGERKAPGSPVAGKANVFIFPNLDAGNIGYKITERLGGAAAIGPIIQGLTKPMNDLSRGAKASDIVDVAAICALRKET